MNEFAERLVAGASEMLAGGLTRVAVVGLRGDTPFLLERLNAMGAETAAFDPDHEQGRHPLLCPWGDLAPYLPDLLVIASDEDKESLLRNAAEALQKQRNAPRVVLCGVAHQDGSESSFVDLEAPALVPSYATGHEYTRRHLYDCLANAASAGRRGAIVELGSFKGGTTVWLARAAAALGLEGCPVIGFDSWQGFPPRRSLLDLYEHPRCVFSDLDAVRKYTEPHGIELVPGDIFETAPRRLASEPVLLAFVDTDNYSGTKAALETIVPNLVPGAAIILDHFFTTEDYVYTVGERIAATEVLETADLLHLHGTGVFVNVP